MGVLSQNEVEANAIKMHSGITRQKISKVNNKFDRIFSIPISDECNSILFQYMIQQGVEKVASINIGQRRLSLSLLSNIFDESAVM